MEEYLQKDVHSFKSRYIIQYWNPYIVENFHRKKKPYVKKKFKKMSRNTLLKLIDKRLNRMRCRTRNCICMFYGLQGRQSIPKTHIAKKLRVSTTTVLWHIRRGLTMLSNEFGDLL